MVTWMVWKIFIKVTTYYVMKAMDMDAEAHSWITDWGPLVNTFLYFLQWPGSRLIIFLYGEPYLFLMLVRQVIREIELEALEKESDDQIRGKSKKTRQG